MDSRKLISIIAVLAMVLAGTAAVSMADATGESEDPVTADGKTEEAAIGIDMMIGSDGAVRTIKTNASALSGSNMWNIKGDTNQYNPMTMTNDEASNISTWSETKDGITVTVKSITSKPGFYTLNVGPSASPPNGGSNVQFNLRFDVSVDKVSGSNANGAETEENSANKITQSLYYKLDVVYAQGGVGTLGYGESLSAVVGEIFTSNPSYSIGDNNENNALNVNDYHWYAIGLPNGFAMDPATGVIKGVADSPTASDGESVTIIATEKSSGAVYMTNGLKMTVTAADPTTVGFKYSVTVDNNAAAESGSGPYTVKTGQTVKVAFKDTSNNDLNGVTVTVMKKEQNSNIVKSTETLSGSSTDIVLDGTGAYQVVMTYSPTGDVPVTKAFTLYVLPNLIDIQAGIIVDGS